MYIFAYTYKFTTQNRMKAKILEALQTKFTGVDAKVLDRIATKLAKTVTTDEDVQTAVDGVSFNDVLTSYGDARANEASASAVKNYESKHKLKDGKPVVVEAPKPDVVEKPSEGDDETPAWAKALIDSNKALADRLNAIEGEKTANGYKAQLTEVLKDAPEKVRSMYEATFDRLKDTFKDADDFSGWLEGEKTTITELSTQLKAAGGKVTPPKSGGGSTDGINPALKAQVDAAKETAPAAAPAIMGMPTK